MIALEQTSILAVWTWLIHLPILGAVLLAFFVGLLLVLLGLFVLGVKLLL